jgi:hypothetical protein
MWIINALLILAAWTALGFAAALLFFRLGFGFEIRQSDAERAPQMPRPEREQGAGDRRHAPQYVALGTRRRAGDDRSTHEQLAHGRPEHAEPVRVAG